MYRYIVLDFWIVLSTTDLMLNDVQKKKKLVEMLFLLFLQFKFIQYLIKWVEKVRRITTYRQNDPPGRTKVKHMILHQLRHNLSMTSTRMPSPSPPISPSQKKLQGRSVENVV